jgi:phage gp29-like protein
MTDQTSLKQNETAGEVATTRDGRDITRPYYIPGQIFPNMDPVLSGRGGGDLRLYDEVFRDGQVKSTFQQRQRAIFSKELVVEPGGKRARDREAANFIEQQLKAVRFDRATEGMSYGLFYGFAVSELIYELQGNLIGLKEIRVRNVRRFGFDGDGQLLLKTTKNPLGELLPDKKFWVFSTGDKHDDNPYGMGLGMWCYWPVYFKREGLRSWVTFLDKYASPTALGSYPPNATDLEKTKLLAALRAVHVDSGISIPEGMKIELIQAARSGTADYEAMHRTMDDLITKIILSQTMTTESGASYSQSKTHQNTKDDVVKADADLICESFNAGPVKWLVDFNFAGAAYPRVFRRTDTDKDLDQVASFFIKLDQIGYQPTEALITAYFGEGWERKPESPVIPQPTLPAISQTPGGDGSGTSPAEFAAADSAALPSDQVDALAEQADSATATAMDAIINELKALVMKSQSMADLADELLKLYPALKPDQLADVLAQALAVAQLTGRYDLIQGN